jgi:Dolichyl-phosphate-mannose-protein mannosyltransferase
MIGKSVACWFRKDSLPRWTLVVAALVELLLCVQYHRQRWERVVSRRVFSKEHVGEGLVIQWNGLGYYAWLRSLLIDGDWDFDNEFDEHNLYGHYVPPPQFRTPLGRRANQWSVGPACLWAVTVVPGHFFLKASGGSLGPWATDGYSLPYQLFVGVTSLLVALLGLAFLYGICRTQARPARAALAAVLLTLGTTVVYFNAIEISLPHGLGTTLLAGLVWYWLTTYGSLRPGRWFLVGILIGAAALVRWQLATFAVLPTAEGVLASRRSWRTAALAGLAAAGVVASFLPQVIAWRCVYGAWLVNPMQGVNYHWLTPSFWAILCSQDRSLFYWTPLTFVAFAGAIGGGLVPSAPSAPTPRPRGGGEGRTILALAFLIQVYALAGMWGRAELLETTRNYGGVFLARSYGFRDLTESLVVLAPGLAWLLERAPPWRFRVLAGLGLLLVAWNLLLVSLYTHEMIPAMEGASPSVLLTQTAALVRNTPLTLLQALGVPVLIGLLRAVSEWRG